MGGRVDRSQEFPVRHREDLIIEFGEGVRVFIGGAADGSLK